MWQRLSLVFAYVAGGLVTSYLTIRDFMDTGIVTHAEIRFTAEGWNPNDLAITLAIGIPFAALLIRKPTTLLLRAVGAGYLLIAPVAIILTASRGGAIAMVVSALSIPLI